MVRDKPSVFVVTEWIVRRRCGLRLDAEVCDPPPPQMWSNRPKLVEIGDHVVKPFQIWSRPSKRQIWPLKLADLGSWSTSAHIGQNWAESSAFLRERPPDSVEAGPALGRSHTSARRRPPSLWSKPPWIVSSPARVGSAPLWENAPRLWSKPSSGPRPAQSSRRAGPNEVYDLHRRVPASCPTVALPFGEIGEHRKLDSRQKVISGAEDLHVRTGRPHQASSGRALARLGLLPCQC